MSNTILSSQYTHCTMHVAIAYFNNCIVKIIIHTLPPAVGVLPEGSPASPEPHREPSQQRSASFGNHEWLVKTSHCLLVLAAMPVGRTHHHNECVCVCARARVCMCVCVCACVYTCTHASSKNVQEDLPDTCAQARWLQPQGCGHIYPLACGIINMQR